MFHDPLIGQQLAHIRIDRLLGRGGMGQVYAGHDLKLDRPVAVKVIAPHHRSDPAVAQRFLREARAVAAWRHPHIVTIYAADDQDGLAYFVMDYLDGADLGAVLERAADAGHLLLEAEVLRIGQAIASALDYAHSKGMIHRDVKPANVMITDDGRVVLVDFGLALNLQQGSIGEVFGSAHYLAPEQARRSADAVSHSDLYSLGVILYELLTGRVPFDDPSATSVALQHLTVPPPPPRTINPALSPAVEAVLVRALSKAPADRYPTGAALMTALAVALGPGIPIDAPPDTPPALRTDDLVGQTLGSYRVEAPLGQGGMAVIYRGRDTRLNRTVAIKVIDAPFQQDTAYADRFAREAQAIAHLDHPHIVRLYEFGDRGGLLYMAMEYIDGRTLEAEMAAQRAAGARMAAPDILALIRTIGSALDYAHQQGVVHRDVKPANILLDRRGRAVLADFGLALMTEIGTRGEIFGTPHYIAPEQVVSSAHAVPQSDLYAVGVMLYALLVGRVPFDGADPLAIAMQHLTEPPPPPRQVRPDLSVALEAVLLRALAKEPRDRYPSGAALTDALAAAFGTAALIPPLPAAPVGIPAPPLDTPRGSTIPAALAPGSAATSAPGAAPRPPSAPSLPPAPVAARPPSTPAPDRSSSRPALPPMPVAARSPSTPTGPVGHGGLWSGAPAAGSTAGTPAPDPRSHMTPPLIMEAAPPAHTATTRPVGGPPFARRPMVVLLTLVIVLGLAVGLVVRQRIVTAGLAASVATTITAQQTVVPDAGIGSDPDPTPTTMPIGAADLPTPSVTTPAPAASVPAAPADLSGAVVVEDALTAATWYTQSDGSGSMGYQDGRYRLSIPAGTNTFWSQAPGGLAIPDDNVVLAVNVEPRAGSGGILFGFQSLSNHYRLVTQADGTFRLERRQGRTVDVLAEGSGAGTGRLALVLRGTTARVYGGDTLLGEVTLPDTPKGGKIGLILATADAAEVLFDTFTVRTAP